MIYTRLAFTSVSSALLLASCVSSPEPLAPKATSHLHLPKRFDTSAATPDLHSSLSKIFADPQLTKLTNHALTNNPNLKASAARLEEAGFNVRRSRAPLFPSLTSNSSANRSSNNPLGINRTTSESYSTTLDTRWEVDLWGRIRSGATAAAANKSAAKADYAAAQQSIAAQTAQAYFELLRANSLLKLAEQRLASFSKTHSLINRRFESGTADLGSLDLARTDIESARSQAAQSRNARDQASRRLSTLLGSYPSSKINAVTWPKLTRSVPAGIPSQVLLKRPDINSAYQRLRAADSSTKVAHRDLFPRFSLTASGGSQSNILKNLADSNFSTWSLLANLSAPILDGGARRAELGAANARSKQALANYHSTALNALREVEDALGSELYLKQQYTATQRALNAARSAEKRAQRNYDSGLISVLDFLQIQRRRFSSEEAIINLRALRYQNRVSLALALGKAY